VSVAATLAAIAGEPLGTDADLRAGGPGSARIEFYADPPKARTQGALGAEPAQAFVSGSLKLIRYRERAELYDLAADPAERRDLSVERPEVVRDLAASLSDLGIERAGSATVEADDALRERLQALGYLEGQ
jgi:arylsulfatase A-like enzyme